MANLPETPDYPAGVYQLETSDPVLGGPGGISNRQAEQLANRTAWLKAKVDAFIDGTVAVLKATKLATARTLSISGAGSGSTPFDGSANASIVLTLADSGAVAGTYPKVTVNAKGIVTGGAALAAADIPGLDWSKINGGKPTTLGGYGITDAAPLASPGLTGNPTAPTPAQFDADSSIATSEFTQRALGNFQTAAVLTAPTTLTAADVGKAYSLNVGSSVILPLFASARKGSSFLFFNADASVKTITRQGGDVLYALDASGSNISTATSITLNPGEWVIVTANSQWQAMAGSYWNKSNIGPFAFTLGQTAQQKLPGGWLIKRGVVSSASFPHALTFPEAFPNFCQCLMVQGWSSALGHTGRGQGGATVNLQPGQSGVSGYDWIAIGY